MEQSQHAGFRYKIACQRCFVNICYFIRAPNLGYPMEATNCRDCIDTYKHAGPVLMCSEKVH